MRRLLPLAWVLLLAALAGASSGKSADGQCAGSLPSAPAGLPSALVVTTNCGVFRLDPNRSVAYEGPWNSPVPKIARGYWMDLTWYGRLADGRLVIGRGMKELWRSQGTFPGPRKGDVDAVAIGGAELAFSFSLYRGRTSSLYVARYGQPERLIAHDEIPLTFTGSDELVTSHITRRGRWGALALRTGEGSLSRRLAVRAIDPRVDHAGKVVLFRSARRLLIFDGERVRRIASLRELGMTGIPMVEPLGQMVAVHDRRRLVVLEYSGAVFASTALPKRPKRADGVSSPVVVNADRSAVAFTATKGNTAYASSGRETVYVLAAGERQARPLLSMKLTFKVCERMSWLAWQGRWLLYADSEQRAAVVDTSGASAPIELSDVIALLPGISQDAEDAIFDIAWD